VTGEKKMARSEVDEQRVSRPKGPGRRQGKSMHLQPVVLLQSPDLAFVTRLRGCFRVQEVGSWEGLNRILPSVHPTSVVVVDPYDRAAAPSNAFWEILERLPSVAVIPAFELQPDRFDHMRAMVTAGVSEFLNLDREDAASLAGARIRSAFARPFKRRIEAALSRHAGVEARTILIAAAEVCVRGNGPKELADEFSIRRKTLSAWCAAHGLPQPRRLFAWIRILLAAHLLEDAGRTRVSVAAACGYRTDRSLRRVIHRFVGPQPPRQPLFDAAVAAFNVELRQCREDLRSAAAVNLNRIANPMQDGDVQTYPAGPRLSDDRSLA
jgi:AraC-like DNA-binding protein